MGLGGLSKSEVPAGVPSLPGNVFPPQYDADLTWLVAIWPQLPNSLKSGILALVRASLGMHEIPPAESEGVE